MVAAVSVPGATGRPRRRIGAALGVIAVAVAVMATAVACGDDPGTALGAAGVAGGVMVRSASVGEGDRIAAGYLVLVGGETPDRLVGASSPSAGSIQLHRTTDSGAMAPTDAVEVPAGAEVPFVPGGDHLMLEALVSPLLPGDVVALDLEFAGAGTLRVEAPVIALVDVLDAYDGGW